MPFMELPDLDTRSVLDVVEDNFKRIDLKTYAIRWIYAGDHTLSKQEVIDLFTKTIDRVNSYYCEINVSGLLLVYDSYFVCILEGSEDTVHRFVRYLFTQEKDWVKSMEELEGEEKEETGSEGLTVILADDKQSPKQEYKQFFKRLKILMCYHSVQLRLFHGWRTVISKPPSLVGKLDVHGPLEEHMEQLRICINKINKLSALATANDLSFEGLTAADPKMEALPEVALLDFLLESPYLLDLRKTAALHRRVDDHQFYFEEVWPLPTHYTPCFLYKLKVDDSFVEPLPVMPWEVQTREGEDEEPHEEGSQTSSSD